MRVKDALKISLGVVLGAVLYAYISDPVVVEPQDCDPTEHSRIKIALEECSDAVMVCTWGEDYKETVLEE